MVFEGEKAKQNHINASILSLGELCLTQKWEGIEKTVLRLHGGVRTTGDVICLVGEYAGPEHHAIQYAHSSGQFHKPSLPLCHYFGTQCPDEIIKEACLNPFADTTVSDVEDAWAKRGLKLSQDQKDIVDQVATSDFACVGVSAVPGAGKTVGVTGLILSLLGKLDGREVIVWLAKSRKVTLFFVLFCWSAS